jgi:hypothetical protein
MENVRKDKISIPESFRKWAQKNRPVTTPAGFNPQLNNHKN